MRTLHGSKDALLVQGRSKEKGKDNKKGEKDNSKDHSKSKGGYRIPSKNRLRCWNCSKRGYLKNNYRNKMWNDDDSSTNKSFDDETIDAFINYANMYLYFLISTLIWLMMILG